jgi:hypothetical protein
MRQHTSAYVSIRQHTSVCSDLELASYVGMRQHTLAYVSIRQHTSVCSDLELAALVVEAAVVVKAVRHLVAQDAADAAVVARV